MTIDTQQLPEAPEDALISGKTWNLLRRAGAMGIDEGSSEIANWPITVEMVMVIVDKGPSGEAEPTDNTYWLKNVDIDIATSSGGSLNPAEYKRLDPTKRADADESLIWTIGTNLAEHVAGSHSIAVGTLVRARMIRDPGGTRRFEFSVSPPSGMTAKQCDDTGAPVDTEKFLGGFTITFAGSQVNIAPNITPDPANPGVLVVNGNGATCGPILLGLDCSQVVQNVKYVGGVFYKTVCGTDVVVFSTSACPTPAGVSSADFFAYNA